MQRLLTMALAVQLLLPVPARAADDQFKAYEEITNSILCPACIAHNEILAHGRDAGAEQAKEDIKQRLANGETKDEIIAAYVAQYGKVILAVPQKEGFDVMAWLIPPLGVIAGSALVYLAVSRWTGNHQGGKSKRKAEVSIDAVDAERISAEVRKYL